MNPNPWQAARGRAELERERKEARDRRFVLHEKAVERRKKQKKNQKRSKK